MRKNLLFNPSIESKKEYLTRIAGYLRIIRKCPENMCFYPEIAGMTAEDVKELENYICELIMPEIKKISYLAAKKNELLDWKDVITNITLASVIQNFHTYNDPDAVGVEGGYSFDVFAKIYIRNSVREAFIEKTGLKKHQLEKANRVRKAKMYIVDNMHKSYEDVSVEDVYSIQNIVSDAAPLSINCIRDVFVYMDTPVYYDEFEDFEIAAEDQSYIDDDNEKTVKMLHEMFYQLRKPERYVFLKRFMPGDERITYKQLAMDIRLIELCKEDPVCKRNLNRGGLEIARPEGKIAEERCFENIEYVKTEFLEYLYGDAIKKFKRFVSDNSLSIKDFEGWLDGWIRQEMSLI